jgi:hypothetical protein
MRRLSLVLLLAVTACAGGGGGWPTLARRPIEGPPPVLSETRKCAIATGTASCGAPVAVVTAPIVPQLPTAPVAIDDVAAKLAVIDRDLTDAAARLAAQRTAATAAATARGTPTDTPAWAKAQLELTALDRVGNQIGDIRERLDAIAGTLAAASAGGTDVAAPLLATGRLIARATAMQGDYDTTAAALR